MFKNLFNGLFGDGGDGKAEREAMRREAEQRAREARDAIEKANNDYKDAMAKLVDTEKASKEELKMQLKEMQESMTKMKQKYELALSDKEREMNAMWEKVEELHVHTRDWMKEIQEKHRMEIQELEDKFLNIMEKKDGNLQVINDRVFRVQNECMEKIVEVNQKAQENTKCLFESYRLGLTDNVKYLVDTIKDLKVQELESNVQPALEDFSGREYRKSVKDRRDE